METAGRRRAVGVEEPGTARSGGEADPYRGVAQTLAARHAASKGALYAVQVSSTFPLSYVVD